ncbi:putative dehydrogenase [Kribbella amoyensis]|uniref:Putative dehydrogenase n=1 Tax=Kribbella amoyensis TaxID=996641 RepID=A0A561BS47_9ACTN|nr:Gfo/Idh/MocA family oxidoreductase [Kribbella amoyensis]TWD81714.1 putative dehydrogenase [Kribbella amoyensis]
MSPTADRTESTSPGPPYGVAIVGTGGIANAHADALSTFAEQVRLVACADLDPDRAKAFADRRPGLRTGTSLAEILAPGDIDTVVVCTPPASHVPLAIEALEAGVNVVVEKPPTLSLRQLRELAEVEERSPGTVSCIFQHRFGPGAEQLRQLHRDGSLGRPLVGVCNTLWCRDQPYFDVPWRGKWDIEGGGPTMGHGIHQFDLLLDLWGPWSEVTAYAGKLARRTATEDVSCAIVRFESGAVATITNSLVSPRQDSYLRFDYERATVELDHLYGYTGDDWTFTAAPGADELTWTPVEGGRSGHRSQYAAWLRARSEGTTPPVSLQQAAVTMELIAAIYRSAITERPVGRAEIQQGGVFADRMDGFNEPWNEGKTVA